MDIRGDGKLVHDVELPPTRVGTGEPHTGAPPRLPGSGPRRQRADERRDTIVRGATEVGVLGDGVGTVP